MEMNVNGNPPIFRDGTSIFSRLEYTLLPNNKKNMKKSILCLSKVVSRKVQLTLRNVEKTQSNDEKNGI